MNSKNFTTFLIILISPLFSQFEENLMTVSFNGLSSQEKIDTLYFVKTQADKIIIDKLKEDDDEGEGTKRKTGAAGRDHR